MYFLRREDFSGGDMTARDVQEWENTSNWSLTRHSAKCRMLNAKCKIVVFPAEIIETVRFAHTIFCILHFEFCIAMP